MKFFDLKFEDTTEYPVGIQAVAFFDNGYGASIIKNEISYGHEAGRYELAVLKGEKGKSSLCYDTPITSDVIGHLSPNEISDLLEKIEALPQAPTGPELIGE